MLDQMAACLAGGGRIEIRGFGSEAMTSLQDRLVSADARVKHVSPLDHLTLSSGLQQSPRWSIGMKQNPLKNGYIRDSQRVE